VKRILIIGGYGNFGSYIARALATDPNVSLLIGGRSKRKADAFAASLSAANPAFGCALDIDEPIDQRLREIGPDIVIHTTGPFQLQDHRVARAAIGAGAHYLDLADARQFVTTIAELDDKAKSAGVAVISGASSVPTPASTRLAIGPRPTPWAATSTRSTARTRCRRSSSTT